MNTVKHVQFHNSGALIQAGGGTAHKPFSPEGLAQGVSSCRIGWLVLGRPQLSKVQRSQKLIRKIYVQHDSNSLRCDVRIHLMRRKISGDKTTSN